MTQQQLPLTFGVEREFGIAYLEESTPLPCPDDAEKILYFPETDEDYADMPKHYPREDWAYHAISSATRRSVRKTLKNAGFNATPYEKESTDASVVSLWEVVTETSINNSFPGPYKWTCMEVRSPVRHSPLLLAGNTLI